MFHTAISHLVHETAPLRKLGQDDVVSSRARRGWKERKGEREREIEWRRTSAAAAKNHDKSEPRSQESDPKKTSVWRATCMPVASGVCKEGALQRNLLGLGQAGKKASRFSTIAVCRMPSLLNNDQPSPPCVVNLGLS